MTDKMAKGTKGKTVKRSGHEEVVEFMSKLEHPQKLEIEEVRSIILSANKQISEHVKWNAPSFHFDEEDRITFNLQGKGFFRLIFHRGSKVKEPMEEGLLLEDTTGLLEWVATDRAVVKFSDMNDVLAKKDKLTELVTNWIEATYS